ncbi:MAG: hypothetical protein ACFFD1_13055 [Candidatus Thorarchaeota archaeon]
MSNKSDQMNIRISADLKEKIQSLARERNLKTSDFVRQTIEDAIEGKPSISKEQSFAQSVLRAGGLIAQIDSGKSIHVCMQTIFQVAEENYVELYGFSSKMSREERELEGLKVKDAIAKKLNLSPIASMCIVLMITTYHGFLYNQDILQIPLPLSTFFLETLNLLLEQQKSHLK